jgi:hypothetical protein
VNDSTRARYAIQFVLVDATTVVGDLYPDLVALGAGTNANRSRFRLAQRDSLGWIFEPVDDRIAYQVTQRFIGDVE